MSSSSLSSNTNMINIINIDLPNDMVFEILSWVPAKSLLRLRWACKYWFDLITRDRAFIKKHFLHHHTTSTTNDDDRIINNTRLLFSDYSISPMVCTMKLGDNIVNNHDVDDDDDGTSVNMDCYNLPFSNDFDDYYILDFCGSCNGLILLFLYSRKLHSNPHTYLLWNPCTREFKEFHDQLPNTTTTMYPAVNDSYGCSVLGFGYDHTIDDYKVIRIVYYKSQLMLNDNDHLNITEIGIYTLGSNSWNTKIVTDDHHTLLKLTTVLGLFVNGALHWMNQSEHGLTGTIICFDIAKEEHREIQGPKFISNDMSTTTRLSLVLSVLNGCLCICDHLKMTDDGKNFIIWMMKDCGVKDSWTKLFTIDMEKVVADTRSQPYYAMGRLNQLYSKDGGILMVSNRKVIAACSSKKKNDKARFIYGIRDYENRFVAATYIESLVSLNSSKYLTLVGSKTTTVTKKDLLEYEIVDGCLVKTSIDLKNTSE